MKMLKPLTEAQKQYVACRDCGRLVKKSEGSLDRRGVCVECRIGESETIRMARFTR